MGACGSPCSATLQNVKNICFHEGLPTKAELLNIYRDNGHFICVFGDLMSESANSVEVEQFVCIGSHHLNMTIICLVQNLFQKGKVMHTLSLNTHYFVLYKNRRDQEQIQRFGRQPFPQQSIYVVDAYRNATSTPYGYLLVDLNPHSNKLYSFRSRIFPCESSQWWRNWLWQIISFYIFLSSCDKEQRKTILQTTTDDQLKLLVEIVLNILRGVIPTSTRTRNLFRSNKKQHS
jgi:hypothetical protein